MNQSARTLSATLEAAYHLAEALATHRRTGAVHLTHCPHRGFVLFLTDVMPTHRAFRAEVQALCDEFGMQETMHSLENGLGTFIYTVLPSLEELGSPVPSSNDLQP